MLPVAIFVLRPLQIGMLLAALALHLATFHSAAADCSSPVPVRDTGWYNDDGFHDSLNLNFFAGYQASSQSEFRNWFLFDLPALDGTVVAAELRLYTFAIRSTNSSETLELHHVATPVSTLTNGGAGLLTVFEDLATGPLYATHVISVTQASSFVSIPLNSNAISVINASSGQPFALGGRLATLPSPPPYPTNDIQLFGFSYSSSNFVQLKLSLASTSAPTLVTQPPAMLFVASGNTAVIEVETCGATPVRYQWFFNNSPLLFQTGPRLVIPGVTPNNAGAYFAVVTNLFGATTTSVTRLLVDIQPATIATPPGDMTIHVGGNAEFNASVQGSPAPIMSWSFKGAVIRGATNQHLVVPHAQYGDAGVYTITASNLFGSQSRSATLTVEPLVIGGPTDLVLDSGSDGVLTVAIASTLPNTFQWRRNGTNISAGSASYLPFFEVSSTNAGSYDVIVANSAGARTSRVAQVTVTNTPPVLSDPSNLSIPIGATVALVVSVAGSHPLGLQWFRDGAAIVGATNAQHFIENASINDQGVYQLVASNAFGISTSAMATAAVVGQAPSVSMPADYLPFLRPFTGDALLLTANIQGGPPPALQWKFYDMDIPGATNATLFHGALRFADSGNYKLVATNRYGTNIAEANLDVTPRRGLDRWEWRNPLPQGNDLDHTALTPGRYVAGGKAGSIVTSTNGMDWTLVPLASVSSIRAVTARETFFAALTEDLQSGQFLFLSLDGFNWFPQHIPGFTSVTALEFLGEELHAFGYSSGNIQHAFSTDGATWTSTLARGLSASPDGIAYGNGLFVIAGPGWTARSVDGTNFIQRALPHEGFNRVRFVNDRFLGVAGAGTLWQSTNGQHWNPQTIAGNLELEGVAYGNGRIVIVGQSGTVRASTDGQNWEVADAGTENSLNEVRFDGTQFLVAGDAGILLTSGNGLDWTSAVKGHKADLLGIVYTNELFVAVGSQGTILTSPNAVDWTARSSSTVRDLHAITYGAGNFVAVGQNGVVVSSSDGLSWANRASPTTNDLRRITYGRGRFVAVGHGASIITSTNAQDWVVGVVPGLPAHAQLEGVTFGKGAFVAVGGYALSKDVSVILRSINGTDWVSLANVDFGVILRGVAFLAPNIFEQYFYCVGPEGIAAFSTNSLNWRGEVLPDADQTFRQTIGIDRRFVILGNEGAISSRHILGSISRHRGIAFLHDAVYAKGKVVAVGKAGAIVESEGVAIHLGPPQVRGGTIQFSISGGMDYGYSILSSEDLEHWELDGSIPSSTDGEPVIYTSATNTTRRYFRALP